MFKVNNVVTNSDYEFLAEVKEVRDNSLLVESTTGDVFSISKDEAFPVAPGMYYVLHFLNIGVGEEFHIVNTNGKIVYENCTSQTYAFLDVAGAVLPACVVDKLLSGEYQIGYHEDSSIYYYVNHCGDIAKLEDPDLVVVRAMRKEGNLFNTYNEALEHFWGF